MNELESWRNRGVRDPLDIIIAQEQRRAKREQGCFGCAKRPVQLGGTGECNKNRKTHGCGFTTV